MSKAPTSAEDHAKSTLNTYISIHSLIIFTILHISTLHSALAETDVTLAAIEPTLWLQVEVHFALVACSVFCLRPFMAAVSTNYGTAGDSNLESSASASRSKSKSGSGSGSGSGSRSRSLCRVQRKRAGTERDTKGHQRTASKEGLCEGMVKSDQLGNGPKKREQSRTPMRRSIFPIGEPGKTSARLDKGKDGRGPGLGLGSGEDVDVDVDVDAIELMPQTNRHSRMVGNGANEDPDAMVIRKEVQYSVQYEYDEARRRGQGPSKRVSNDAMAYV